jgi:RNA polymerase sigma factor (sigma-70 family)
LPDDTPTFDRAALERLFLEHLSWIERFAAGACRRHGWSPEETEEFTARLLEKLITDDYDVLRKHRGESKLTTYLGVVISRFFNDYCDQLWGRWRNSERARQLGESACLLEKLTERDGLGFEIAADIVLRSFLDLTRAQLEYFWNELPHRTRRRVEREDALEDLPSPEPEPEDRLLGRENDRRKQEVLTALQEAASRLPAEDRTLLKLRFGEGWQVARIARYRGLEEKPLYRRIEKIREKLGLDLQAIGIRHEEIGEVLRGMGLSFLPKKKRKVPRDPSTDDGDGPEQVQE